MTTARGDDATTDTDANGGRADGAPARVGDRDHGGGTVDLPPDRARRLRIGNIVVGLAHAAQVVVILLLTNDFSIPVVETFPQGPPGTPPPAPETVFDVPLGPAVALFLALAAIDHLTVAAPGVHRWYEDRLRQGINPARWIEYSISASLMITLIALLSGVTNLTALIPLFGVNAMMILFGMRMERVNDQASGRALARFAGLEGDGVDWRPYVYGCLAGIVPWIAIGVSLFGAEAESGQVPTFVFGIFFSLFVLFNTFSLNQWLQYRRVGPWRDYVFGEWAYLVFSLVAKTALAWQVFANVLIDG